MRLLNPEQILVVVDFSRASESAILHGLEMAKIFHRGLSLLHVSNRKSHKLFKNYTKEAASKRLNAIAEIVQEQNCDIKISNIVLEGDLNSTIYNTTEDINAIMVVLGIPLKPSGQIRRARQAIRIMKNSRIPYLMVREKFPIKNGYKNIVLPLDDTREYKEKVLWASYFSRFYDSKFIFLCPKAKTLNFSIKLNQIKNLQINYLTILK
jgi:nucleotide-binding universal stress UspA family protein